ncbi:hypothetical protein Baya_4863 [Bagarius yarrelli]|uniref:Uncharacterized protein n=1 Tax=Bagarius yarrelli TaxID=175774 RepID=A0A556TRW1_BAGYA|nr:hypothetical protein Baya_4863 [Bagarius yarrelli]
MIRQQLYGPGGPYENRTVNPIKSELRCSETLQANRKRWQNQGAETIIGQQPAKIPKRVSPDFKHLEIDFTITDLKPVNIQTVSSFSTQTNSPKHQNKSSLKSENDQAHSEAIAMILQQLYGAGGFYENLQIGQSESKFYCSKTFQAKRNSVKEEMTVKIPHLGSTVYEHPPESNCTGATADLKSVHTQPIPCSSTASLDPQFELFCKSNNSDNTSAKVLQQLYSSNKPYETPMVNETESEPHSSITFQTKWNSYRNNHKDDEQSTSGQKTVKKPNLSFSDLDRIPESTLAEALSNLKQVNTQPIVSISKGSRKHQFKSSRKYDNDDDNQETIAMIRKQLYSPGGPYENLMVN